MVAEFKKPETLKSKDFKRPLAAILEDFSRPIPDRFIKTKTIKGTRIPYVPWYTYIKLLHYYAPGFSWSLRVVSTEGRTVVEGRLSIKAAEGEFSMMATGSEENDVDSYGDPTSNSEAMALRRACAKFGLGLHLWEK